MTDWLKIIAYAMITLFLGFLLKEFGFRGSKLFVILGTVITVGAVSLGIGKLMDELSFLTDGSEERYVTDILKIIGIGYISGACADICTDLGENGISGSVIMVGKVEMLLIASPYIIEIVKQGVEMI